MRPSRLLLLALPLFFLLTLSPSGYADYRSPDELISIMRDLANSNTNVRLHELGETPAGHPLAILEVGEHGEEVPGILVVANMTGDSPLASKAALDLATRLTGDWAEYTEDRTWYIYPCGNPDGYASFFADPRVEEFRNGRPFNDDVDAAIDEDGPDDLNGDGLITVIRQRHPEGEWVVSADSPWMEKLDPANALTERYRLFQEGVDNDGDGVINEDGIGGVNPGNNFPHRFELHTDYAGLWAGSETESRELMKFAFARPHIAMVLVFGRSNTLLNVPETKRSADLMNETVSVTGWMARSLGLDRGSKIKLGDLLPMVRDAFGRPNLTAERLLGWLSDEAETEPHPKDLVYWNELADRYKAFLDSTGATTGRLTPPDPVTGSVEEWAYYQYGTPTFALDFWTVPEPAEIEADTAAADTSDDGNRADKPAQANGSGDEDRNEADKEKMALLAYNPDAWLEWTPYDHPTLGPVEIGGMRPFATLAPRASETDSLIDTQLPFVLELADALPEIVIDSVAVNRRAQGVYEVDAWITNIGFLPYPTYHGQRTERPAPVAAILEGVENDRFIEGRGRVVLDVLAGNGGSERVRWVISADEGDEITIKSWSYSAGTDERTVELKGGDR